MNQLQHLTAILLIAGSSATVAAQDSTRVWGFTSARADSYTAAFIYAGYGYRGVFAVGGVMFNPRSKYTELAAGVGARRHIGGAWGGTHFLAAALSKAADSRYVQVFYLPSARLAGIDIEATLEGYIPLDPTGAVQYYVTPLSAVRSVSRRVALGASYDLAYERGADASHFLGPTIRVSLPRAQAALDVHGGLTNAPGKMRFSFKSFY